MNRATFKFMTWICLASLILVAGAGYKLLAEPTKRTIGVGLLLPKSETPPDMIAIAKHLVKFKQETIEQVYAKKVVSKTTAINWKDTKGYITRRTLE